MHPTFRPTLRTTLSMSAGTTIGAAAVLAAGLIAGSPALARAAAGSAMPAVQQNMLVQKYCAVCHDDAHANGGLSLQHFDAANADPGVAAMMVSKLKSGALGASGAPLPDKAIQDALLSALSSEAVGASAWTVNRTHSPTTQASILTASVVQEVPSAAHAGEPDMYRLTLRCDVETHDGEMQLAWAPAPPPAGRSMAVGADGKALFTYKVDGTEKMGNGSPVASGPGSAIFYATKRGSAAPRFLMPLPEQTLTVSDLFPGETVVFPFGSLSPTDRQVLTRCFAGKSAGQ